MQERVEVDVARVMLANVLHPTHEYEEALRVYDAALPAVRAAQGNSVLVRAALFGQAHCMFKLRNLEAATATYQAASQLYQEVRAAWCRNFAYTSAGVARAEWSLDHVGFYDVT